MNVNIRWNALMKCRVPIVSKDRSKKVTLHGMYTIYDTTLPSSYTSLNKFKWRWCKSSNKNVAGKEQWLLFLRVHTSIYRWWVFYRVWHATWIWHHFLQTHAILLIVSVPKSSTTKLWHMHVKVEVRVMFISMVVPKMVFIFIFQARYIHFHLNYRSDEDEKNHF